MELFTGLTTSSLLLQPVPLKSYRALQAINVEKLRKIDYVGKLHDALGNVHKDVAIRNEQSLYASLTGAQRKIKCYHLT